MIRKKKEEDRLAAIEKDKRETFEQGLRMEQLEESAAIVEDIINANVVITKEEKCEVEVIGDVLKVYRASSMFSFSGRNIWSAVNCPIRQCVPK